MDLELIMALSVLGVMLIAVDFYVPGFVLGSCGILLMLVATVVCAVQHSLTTTLALACAEILAGGGAAYASIKYFPRTKYGQRMILHRTLEDARASRSASADLVGSTGVAHTVLRPAGLAMINGKRLDVTAESGMIAAGSAIQVIAVQGPQILVRKI